MSIYSWNNTTEHSLNNYAQSFQSAGATNSSMQQGMVSELVYDEKHPIMDLILLPMLRQFGVQSRWLLWLSPNKKLSKHWLEQAGIPTDKVMQLNHMAPITTIDAMEKALKSGNYSVVLGWLPELNEQDFVRLQEAAQVGHSIGFIMRPQKTYNIVSMQSGQLNNLKIHSTHYH
ncbi:SOS-induced cell division inhibitor SulA [Providencia rettgeri]|uniref:SOS-induced cell division inhibitor SulA n=1 Tax=Providencia rettgeri TaxID=587 RepID=UPI0034E07DB5